MEELEFKKSYAALVKAYGWDPGMPWRVHQIIWAYKQIKDVNGSIVECGVGRGGLMSALLESCENWNETGRKMYLFDTFESYQYDKRGKKIVNEDGYKYYARSFSETKKNFSNYSNIEFVVGDVIKTVATGLCGEIALLSLDLNQADAEEHVMRKLFPNLSIGGVIILDDYYAAGRDLQRMRMNRLAEDLNFNILATPHGQGIIVKN
jgi:O-methyltransferase